MVRVADTLVCCLMLAAGTPGVCDPHLNTEANGWDGESAAPSLYAPDAEHAANAEFASDA
jgi:hypothetical protein